jgi:hypothetical protein
VETLGKKTARSAYLSRVPFPRVFELLAATCPESLPAAGSKGPAPIRPREAPRNSLHLNYRNGCVIISRALISSPQGGYMVHAACASTARAPALLPTRHFLIGHGAIKNARNSPENNALNFSNWPKKACFRARFSYVLRSKNHHSRVTYRASSFTNHHLLLTNHAFLFDTNKPHRIIIPLRALLKTKEKRFSIQYKFALRAIDPPVPLAPQHPSPIP